MEKFLERHKLLKKKKKERKSEEMSNKYRDLVVNQKPQRNTKDLTISMVFYTKHLKN